MSEVMNETEQEKQLKSLVLVSLGSFLFFFYVFLTGVDGLITISSDKSPSEPQIYGTSTTTTDNVVNPVANVAVVRLNNATIGEGVLEMVLSKPTKLAGAEFDMYINGNLDIKDVICDPEFECYYTYADNILNLVFFRFPGNASSVIDGTIELGTIIYDPDTSAELVVNDQNSNQSTVLEVGSSENLLSPDMQYLPVDQPL